MVYSGVMTTKKSKIPSWSSSAEEIAGNRDLLIQVLLRLPARSLVRFRAVSRQWRFLLMGTLFPPNHIRFNPKPSISGLYYKRDEDPIVHIPLQGLSLPKLDFMTKIYSETDIRIHDSRHGLMLCSYCSYGMPRIIVCNPTTQKYNKFHQRELMCDWKVPFSYFFLCFDPSVSPIYQVVLIKDQESHYDVAICASNRSFWKNIRLETQQLWGLTLHGLLSSNGIVYMITDQWYLIQFDVEKLKLSATLMTFEGEMPIDWIVGYYGERTCGNLVLIVSPESGLHFMLYEMDVLKGRHWVLKHHIDLTQELHNMRILSLPILRTHFGVMRVFCDGENEERDLTIVLGAAEKVISYNHKSGEIKVLCDLPGRDSFVWETTYCDVQPFIGSFCAIY